ncbi:MAG: hypothetical protein HY445_01265 [Candidatus Niyogibacteria bacterium]|nr:hypothetical protein [Candidatus Niyogibacteria bacterium]
MTHQESDNFICRRWCCKGGGFAWGFFFVLIGAFLLAREMGWLFVDVSFWPALIIAFGVYLIVKRI